MTLRRAITALVLLSGLVYVNCLGGGFVWDDDFHFLDNPELMTRSVRSAFTTDLFAASHHESRFYSYRPLTLLAYTWVARASGLQPFGIHLVCVGLHTIAGILVLLLALEWMPLAGAWLTAALFLVHPLHVEAVAWMTGLSEVLAGLLMLASLYALVRAGRGPRWLIAVACVTALLSFLTKETSFALPLVAILFVGRRAWPLFVIAGAGLAARYAAIGIATAPLPHRTLWRHATLAGLAGLQYVKKLLWPWPVAPEYDIWNPAWMWLGFAALCALAGWAVWRYRHLRAPILLIPISLLPALASSPLMATAWLMRDRNGYLAVLGIAWIGGLAASRWRPALAAGLAVLVLWSILSVAATSHWRDTETLWTHTLNVTPNSWRAAEGLATWYYITARYAEADRVLEHGLQYWPNHPTFHRLRTLTRQALAAPPRQPAK